MPGILQQLGPESVKTLKELAETYKQESGDLLDDIPELIEDFEQTSLRTSSIH